MAPKNDKTLFANLATFAVGTLAAGALVAVPVTASADEHKKAAAHAEDAHGKAAAHAAEATPTPEDKKCSGEKKCSGDKACGASTTKGH